jgi:hypothetical protein
VAGEGMVAALPVAIAAVVKKLNFRLFIRLETYHERGQPLSCNLGAESHGKHQKRDPASLAAEKKFSQSCFHIMIQYVTITDTLPGVKFPANSVPVAKTPDFSCHATRFNL